MIRLECRGGWVYTRNEDPRPCTYSVEYSDRALASLVTDSKAMGGYHCPRCRRFGLTVLRTK